ncbi:hypothetical protein PYCC9005_000209 [Savitreella phatthalungensis]
MPDNLIRRIYLQLHYLADRAAAERLRSQVRWRLDRYKSTGRLESEKAVKVAKSFLTSLEKANVGDDKSIRKLAELAYGFRGRGRRTSLAHLTPTKDVEETIPGRSSSRRPVVSPVLEALWQSADNVKRIKFEPPTPTTGSGEHAKPLDRRRLVNAHWRHVADLMRRTPALIDERAVLAMAAVVDGRIAFRSFPAWRKTALQRKQEQTQRHTTNPHRLTKRFLSRIYIRLLDEVRMQVTQDGKSQILAGKDAVRYALARAQSSPRR